MDWDDVRFFLALTRAVSARAAAQELAISHTTVSRRVDALEQKLATRLFDRSTRGYRLTEDGTALLGYAEQAEKILVAAQDHLHLGANKLTGEIRLTLPDVIAEVLIPHMAEFSRLYPGIHVELLIGSRTLDLEQREADMAIRFLPRKQTPPEQLVGRVLCGVASSFYAHKHYLERLEQQPDSGHWLGWTLPGGNQGWIASSPYPELPCRHLIDNGQQQLLAVRHQLGMGMLPCFLADKTPDIIQLPQTQPRVRHQLWLLSLPEHRQIARFKAFRAFIVQRFDDMADQLTRQLGAKHQDS